MHHAFGPDGALYIAQTVRGWMATGGNEGIQRVVWTGETPVEILTLRLSERGFVLRFSAAMAEVSGDPRHFQVRRFQYNYHPLDGSLRVVEALVPVTAVRLAEDGTSAEVELLELQPGFVYELVLAPEVVSRAGIRVTNRTAYYTANRLLSGQSMPGPSRIATTSPAALRAPDAGRGGEVFRLNCMVCHQADGKGSPQAGTPDYTARDSPLRKADDELIAVITQGRVTPDGKMMPPFGNVLPPQAIHDVLAYLRATFLRPDAAP